MAWYIPILIYFARICDVSVGTVRIIMVTKGYKFFAMVLGFIEVTLWIFSVYAVMRYLSESLWAVAGYAAGFATGNYIGMMIEEKIALGDQMVRVVNGKGKEKLADFLRGRGFTVTQIEANDTHGPAELCYVPVKRNQANNLIKLILDQFPDSYITVEDLRSTASQSLLYRTEKSKLTVWRRLVKYY